MLSPTHLRPEVLWRLRQRWLDEVPLSLWSDREMMLFVRWLVNYDLLTDWGCAPFSARPSRDCDQAR